MLQLILLSLLHLAPSSKDVRWYNIKYMPDNMEHWMQLRSFPHSRSPVLSTSYLASSTRHSWFKVPYFNSFQDKVTVTTQGYLYLKSFNRAPLQNNTGYIAPLMSDFQPSPVHSQDIRVYSNREVFVVQWDRMRLPDHFSGADKSGYDHVFGSRRTFSFQSQLHQNGTIIFLYKHIPYPVSNISETRHPLETGLSYSPETRQLKGAGDAMTNRQNIHLDRDKITSQTTVIISPNTELCVHDVADRLQRWCNTITKKSKALTKINLVHNPTTEFESYTTSHGPNLENISSETEIRNWQTPLLISFGVAGLLMSMLSLILFYRLYHIKYDENKHMILS